MPTFMSVPEISPKVERLMTTYNLAQVIILAQEIYDASWGAKKKTSSEEAAEQALRLLSFPLDWKKPIGFLIEAAWTDAGEWAQDTLRRVNTTEK